MAKSMVFYRDHLRKTAASIEVKRLHVANRSVTHFDGIRAASIVRDQVKVD